MNIKNTTSFTLRLTQSNTTKTPTHTPKHKLKQPRVPFNTTQIRPAPINASSLPQTLLKHLNAN